MRTNSTPSHVGRSMLRNTLLLTCATLVTSCANPPPTPVIVAVPPPASASATGTVLAARMQSNASNVDGYKRDVARHIYRTRPDEQFQGVPPPLLRSVVVLTIRVDAGGNPVHVAVVRSNGYKELEEVAMRSVRSAAPLPIPNRNVTRNGTAEYYETWLFREDGLYQIRSLAEPQAIVDE
jgi:protein TonB